MPACAAHAAARLQATCRSTQPLRCRPPWTTDALPAAPCSPGQSKRPASPLRSVMQPSLVIWPSRPAPPRRNPALPLPSSDRSQGGCPPRAFRRPQRVNTEARPPGWPVAASKLLCPVSLPQYIRTEYAVRQPSRSPTAGGRDRGPGAGLTGAQQIAEGWGRWSWAECVLSCTAKNRGL